MPTRNDRSQNSYICRLIAKFITALVHDKHSSCFDHVNISKFPASPKPKLAITNPPKNAPEQPSWPSKCALKVNANLRETRPCSSRTQSASHNRIYENVDRAGDQRRRPTHKWQSHIIRCFIAFCLAAILVTAALVGAMVAVAKNAKGGVEIDGSSVNVSSTSTVSQSDPKTMSRSTSLVLTPWSTITTTSELLTIDSSATFTQESPTEYSQSLEVGSSSLGSSIESTQTSVVHPSTATMEKAPSSFAASTSSTYTSHNMLGTPTSTPTQVVLTSTLESVATTQPETQLTTPITSPKSTGTTTQLSQSSIPTESSTTLASSDHIRTHQSETGDTKANQPAPLHSNTPFTSPTLAAERSSLGGQHSPKQRVHGLETHEWLGNQDPRASRRPGYRGP